MKKRLQGKNPELLIAKFGQLLEKTKPGEEATLEEIQAEIGE